MDAKVPDLEQLIRDLTNAGLDPKLIQKTVSKRVKKPELAGVHPEFERYIRRRQLKEQTANNKKWKQHQDEITAHQTALLNRANEFRAELAALVTRYNSDGVFSNASVTLLFKPDGRFEVIAYSNLFSEQSTYQPEKGEAGHEEE